MDAERAHHRYKEIFDTQERNSMLFADKFKNKFNVEHDPFDIFDQYLGNYNEKDMLNRLMYMDLKVFHPDLTLYASDITAMANSQEVRLPFLDLEMLNLSRKIPSDLKCHGFTTKYIFRKAMKSYLPKDILKMKKKGFTIPTDPWLRKKEVYGYEKNIINQTESLTRTYFNYDYINRLLEDHYIGKENNTRKITCLVSLFVWQQINNINLDD